MMSAIDQLGLTDEELAGLRRQGFVSPDWRRGRPYFKLRFRTLLGERRVRYIGTDPVVARQVEQELADLQASRRAELELGVVAKQAGARLRAGKEKLAAQLDQAGFHFHGLSIRRNRVRK